MSKPLCFEGVEVAHHGILGKLLSRDERVLFQRALDQGVAARLVEKGNTVSFAVVVVRFARGFDAVEGRLEPVVGPGHEQVADVADDGVRLGVGFHFGPRVAVAKGRAYFATWTDL